MTIDLIDQGITSRQLAARTGVTYRRLDYWVRLGLIDCLTNPRPGSGCMRTHPRSEAVVLDRVHRLTVAGFTNIRAAFKIARALADGPVPLCGDFVLFDPDETAEYL